MEPITFLPLYKERVWGGRELERVYGRKLPRAESCYGESWEMTDRPDEQSIVSDGPLAGKSLGELWQKRRREIFGEGFEGVDRFPLLVKILDAREDLSIQVHPPAEIASQLGGEPKTEMWFIAGAQTDAKLYVGLKEGIDEETFRSAISAGTVSNAVHSLRPKIGESIFIPSGRLHAIGAGLLIYEIQQNSDTTYRVFDWNRTGLDGQKRELHVEQSMQCIDFDDIEPGMDKPEGRTLAHCHYFKVDRLELDAGAELSNPDPDRFSIVTVLHGRIQSRDGQNYSAGDFVLVPRSGSPLAATSRASVLQTTIPR